MPQPDTQPSILYVDDERLLHGVLDRVFAREGIKVTAISSAIEAVDALKRQPYDLVITDFKMPDMDGLELLAHVRQEYPDTKTIMITAHANVQHAVGAMQNGAVDYIAKPFSTSVLVERVKEHLAAREAGEKAPRAARAPRRSKGKAQPRAVEFVGSHPSVQQLKTLVPRVAKSQAPVFVHGESGTGKEILSRLIHLESDRADGPYVTLNCANLPRELVESHLFGHRKGAFTGAIEDMTGAFEQADGGTLLLDEITEIELPVQAKLLRVLQEQEFTKIGASESQKVNVRVVATSNRDLQEAIREGSFRADLYHRLAVFPLYSPPLRERASDIPELAGHFVEKYCALYGLPMKKLAPALLAQFMQYTWPGNVRQLENMVHRGVVLAADEALVQPEHVINEFFSDSRTQNGAAPAFEHGTLAAPAAAPLPAASLAPATPPAAPAPARRVTIEEMEREMILNALDETGNNQQAAADLLGICARTIRNKLKKYREEGYVEG